MATPGSEHDEVIRTFREQLDRITAGDVEELFRSMSGHDPTPPRPAPARRRPRRPDTVTYRIRVDLGHTKPPLWRRLELASDLTLDRVHEILQIAFGWTDSHLHRFASGGGAYDPDSEHYLSPHEVAEGELGVPEAEVRLDEVLVEPGDELAYLYDFGDDWEHVLRLEAVLPRPADAQQAGCTAGRRPSPAEDCGGVAGYERFAAATDPTHPDHAAAGAELADRRGPDFDPTPWAPLPFDAAAINDELAILTLVDQLPGPVTAALEMIEDRAVRRDFLRLVHMAYSAPTPTIDAPRAARMVHPFTWLLELVGPDGLELTPEGHLLEEDVAAVGEFLNVPIVGYWRPGKSTPAVLYMRRIAQRAGLLRARDGRLVRTAAGTRLLADPVGMWWRLAERLPVTRGGRGHFAGIGLLVAAAADNGVELGYTLAVALRAMGWRDEYNHEFLQGSARTLAMDTGSALHRLGVFVTGGDPPGILPAPEGVQFARAVLRTWPKAR